MRTLVRRLVIVVAGLALLAACGGGSSGGAPPAPAATSSSATATTTAPARIFTTDELAAALPRSSQVPSATKKLVACPGGDTCVDDTVSVSFELSRPVSADQQEKLAADEFVSDFVDVSASALSDEGAMAARLAKVRGVAERYDGAFDIPSKETSDTTYTPAEKGQGTLDDITIEGWDGFIGSRDQVYTSPDGEGDKHRYQASSLYLVRGTNAVAISLTIMSEPQDEGAAADLARRLATEYIGRLG